MMVTPSSFAAARVPFDSTRRSSRLYFTWFEASARPRLRQRRVRTPHARHAEVADADSADFLVFNQIRHGAHLGFDRREAQRIVHLVKVDGKGSEAAQALLGWST